MPHKCARCGRIYDDNAPELIDGCSCGAQVFLYLKTDERNKKKAIGELRDRDLDENDLDWLEKEFGKDLKGDGKTIHLDVENLTRISKGKYRLDITSLMKGEPIVVKAKEGVYYIDVPYAMRRKKTKVE
ncbi:MAG: hypothetical protein KAU03_00825 [Candidatus Altiarchaeales archaeon]|nr:hypothetical protein [Candidatus Altiarchaeales archaeon]